eukprot:PhM_4_TR8441/c0_g1_i5/m.51245
MHYNHDNTVEGTELNQITPSITDLEGPPTTNVRNELDSSRSPPIQRRKATPLPLRDLFVLGVVMVNESLSVCVIFPFVGYLVDTFHVADSKDSVGYYAGLVAASFQFGQFLSASYMGKLSDRYGRRPILVWSMLVTAVLMPLFGLCQSLWLAIAVRLATGVMNGSFGSAKAAIADITDDSNRASAFSLFSLTWGLGCTLGPLLGGHLYGVSVVRGCPAFVPCAVASLYSWFAFFVSYFCLRETSVHRLEPLVVFGLNINKADGASWQRQTDVGNEEAVDDDDEYQGEDHEVPSTPTWRSVFASRDVRLSMALTVTIAFVDLVTIEGFGIWAIASLPSGGLDMTPDQVGSIITFSGVATMVIPFLFPRMLKLFGYRALSLFRVLSIVWIVLTILLPFSHDFAEDLGSTGLVLALGLWFVPRSICVGSVFSLSYVFLTDASRPEQLAFVHGIGESLGCLARALSPALVSALLAWSLNNGLEFPLNYHLAFLFSAVVLVVQVCVSYSLKQ